MGPPVITHDFETKSACSLLKHGAWVYSEHPTTEAMCLTYNLPWEGDRWRLWHMAHPQHLISESPPPDDLFRAVADGCLMEAHNSFFEYGIWHHVMVRRRGWPAVPVGQYRCSAARASAATLPRALEDAAEVLGLVEQKDMVGHALMKKMSKPRKPLKAERAAWKAEHGTAPMPTLWHEDEEDLYRLWAYCTQDGRTEKALSLEIPHLTPFELRLWQADQALNRRGVRVDLEMVRAALAVATDYKATLNEELLDMTGVDAGTKRDKVKAWLVEHEGLHLPDTKADTLQWYIGNRELTGRARRVLEIVTDVNRTSTRKYQTMLDWADRLGRIRGIMVFCGAERTGRWASRAIQIHNLPARDLIVKDTVEAAALIKTRDAAWIHALYGDVMKFLSHSVRGAIVPAEGRDLMVADYAAIEARIVLWLAGAEGALGIFRSGGDIYCDMASGLYGREIVKGRDVSERQFGKQSILGLGFGMGFVTFLLMIRRYDIHFTRDQVIDIMGEHAYGKYLGWVMKTLWLNKARSKTKDSLVKALAATYVRQLRDAREDPAEVAPELALMKYTVDAYRTRYPEVKAMWREQESAALEAVKSGERVQAGRVTWFKEGRYLNCELPSGRPLRYFDPHIKKIKTSWGEERPALRYYGMVSPGRQWRRIATYGGKLVENITQAVARDVLAVAKLEAYEGLGPYDAIMSVHDELVCEVDGDEGSLEEYERLMCNMPAWADGCPIDAEAERYGRYRK